MSALAATNILEAGDVRAFRAGFAKAFAHLPQPKTDREAEIMLHSARTQTQGVTFAKRAYSHRWLTERNLPSSLPDQLRPKAERLYPRIVTAVGIACGSLNPALKPLADAVRRSMENAVQDCYANGDTDPGIVKQQMLIARKTELHRLVGAAVPLSAVRW